jgi:hypothetical protein
MSNITPIRQWSPPPQQPGGPPGSGQWSWNGCDWVWIMNPIWPMPPIPPGPPCPPYGPPSCFDQVAKAQACWDQSQSLYNLVEDVVETIFANNPSIIPPPPPSAGSGPIIGVTDGSVAAPGQVGEVLSSLLSGTFTGAISGTSASQTALSIMTLTPGDWNVQYWLQVNADIQGAAFALGPSPAGALNSMETILFGYPAFTDPEGTFQGVILTAATTPINVATPTLLAGTLTVWSGTTSVTSGPYTMKMWARRVR